MFGSALASRIAMSREISVRPFTSSDNALRVTPSPSAAAVILAADALSGTTGGANVFRDVEAGPGALAGDADAAADCDCASGSAGGRQDAFEHP